jgi:hypothetical protein
MLGVSAKVYGAVVLMAVAALAISSVSLSSTAPSFNRDSFIKQHYDIIRSVVPTDLETIAGLRNAKHVVDQWSVEGSAQAVWNQIEQKCPHQDILFLVEAGGRGRSDYEVSALLVCGDSAVAVNCRAVEGKVPEFHRGLTIPFGERYFDGIVALSGGPFLVGGLEKLANEPGVFFISGTYSGTGFATVIAKSAPEFKLTNSGQSLLAPLDLFLSQPSGADTR